MKNIFSIIFLFSIARLLAQPTVEIANVNKVGNDMTFSVFLNPTAGQTIYLGNFDINLSLPSNTTVASSMRTASSTLPTNNGEFAVISSISTNGTAINFQPFPAGNQADFDDFIAKITTRSLLGSYKITFNAAPTGSITCSNVQVYSLAATDPFTSTSINAQCSASAMPLDLLDFYAQPTANQAALLTWQTANEINVEAYELERSPNAKNFTPLSKTAAKNGQKQNYSYTDEQPFSGITYYRLKMVDKDGATRYSNTVSIEIKRKTAVKVYPTLTSGVLTIENAKSFEIVNAIGQVVLSEKQSSRNFQSSPNLAQLPNGIYFVRGVDTEGELFSQKIIKN